MILLLLACKGDPVDSSTPLVTDGPFEVGPEVVCEAPVQGWDRFTDEAEARGLVGKLPEVADVFGQDGPGVGSALVLDDLDGDGDVDLLIGVSSGQPDVYENDGTGHFTRYKVILDRAETSPAALAVDLTDDGLPELVVMGRSQVLAYRNLGGLQWEFMDVVAEGTGYLYMTAVAGDVDGDGRVDLAVPSISIVNEAEPGPYGGPDLVTLWDGLSFTAAQSLVVEGDGSRAQVATFTDRDRDGDLDLFVPADLGPPSAFYRNDDGLLTDDASDIGASLQIAAMGIDSADLNGDGFADYCLSDVGPPRCLMSDGVGGYYEGANTFPVLQPVEGNATTIGWSIELADLDNDGHPELFQASGPDPGAWDLGVLEFGDMLWSQGQDVSAEAGLFDVGNHVTAASADLNGDGALDLVVAGPGSSPHLYMNACNDNAWVEVVLFGAPTNTGAFGTVVEGGGQLRELHSLRDKAQGPRRVHLGLGQRDQVELTVTFPDGVVLTQTVPTRREIVVRHPDAVLEFEPGTGYPTPWDLTEDEVRVQGLVVDGGTENSLDATVLLDGEELAVIDGGFEADVLEDETASFQVSHEGRIPVLLQIDPTWQQSPQHGVVARMFRDDNPMMGSLFDDATGTLFVAAAGVTTSATVTVQADHGTPVELGEGGIEEGNTLNGRNVVAFPMMSPGVVSATVVQEDGTACPMLDGLEVQVGTITMAFALCQ